MIYFVTALMVFSNLGMLLIVARSFTISNRLLMHQDLIRDVHRILEHLHDKYFESEKIFKENEKIPPEVALMRHPRKRKVNQEMSDIMKKVWEERRKREGKTLPGDKTTASQQQEKPVWRDNYNKSV